MQRDIRLYPRLQRGRKDRRTRWRAYCGRTRSWSPIPGAPTAPPKSPQRPGRARGANSVPWVRRSAQSRDCGVPHTTGSSVSIPTNAARPRPVTRFSRSLVLAPPHDAYLVPRRNFMMGRWIKGSGWYPNFRQPQLFRKGALRYDTDPVHEGYELLTQRPLGQMQSAIWQFPFRNLEEVIRKMDRYSSLGVRKLSASASRWGARSGTGSGLSSSIICSSTATATAGPDSSLPGEFRGHVLPLCQTLRGDAEPGALRRASRCGDRSPFRASVHLDGGDDPASAP